MHMPDVIKSIEQLRHEKHRTRYFIFTSSNKLWGQWPSSEGAGGGGGCNLTTWSYLPTKYPPLFRERPHPILQELRMRGKGSLLQEFLALSEFSIPLFLGALTCHFTHRLARNWVASPPQKKTKHKPRELFIIDIYSFHRDQEVSCQLTTKLFLGDMCYFYKRKYALYHSQKPKCYICYYLAEAHKKSCVGGH